MNFKESNIEWNFDDDVWNLLQLDQHLHSKTIQSNSNAKQQGERDLKTVDIAGTYQDEAVFFIEIKNYLGDKVENPLIDLLVHELVLKVRDSFSVILSGSRASDDDRRLLKRISVLLKDDARFTICFWIENILYKNDQQTELKLKMMQQELKSRLFSWTDSRVFVTNGKQYDWQKILPEIDIKVL